MCLLEFIDWRYCQSCWYFRPSFVNYSPPNLLSGSPSPLPPSLCHITHTDSVWLGGDEGVWGGGGVKLCLRPYSAGPDAEPTKLVVHPEQKPRRGGAGLRQINTCRKVPLQENLLDDDILNCFLSD
jgi:hypothetical protein